MTYDNLQFKWSILHSHKDISKCLKRTALGYPFPKPQGGRKPYLSEQDASTLADMITDAQQNLAPMPIPDVIDAAYQLRIHRNHLATRLLGLLDCDQLSHQIQDLHIEPPSRGWVNFFSREFGFKLRFTRKIDPNRLSSGCRSKIKKFFLMTFQGFFTLIRRSLYLDVMKR
jgi:hypothetical protein